MAARHDDVASLPRAQARRAAIGSLVKPLVLLIGLTGFAHGQTAETLLGAKEAHAAANAGTIVLIDVRTPEEWRDTGLPQGARPLDADAPAFEVRIAGLRLDHPGKRIALIDRSGAQALAIAWKLAGRGWRDLVAVRGGMLGPNGWLAEKLPVTTYP